MRVALDADGKRVHIDQTHVKEKYFCPSCGEELIMRKGEIRAHHFAHKPNSVCSDGWNYDMSDWHINWQDKFPVEMQEVVKKHNGKTHRADVLIEDTKTVIEFQHSPLSADEFDDRNTFYRELGYKVVWVFDVIDQYEEGLIREHENKENIFIWNRPRSTFNNMDSILKEDNIYFEFESTADDNPRIKEDKDEMAKHPDIDDLLGPEEEEYYECHKEDIGWLVKVAWIPETGFERFAIDKNYFSTEEFVDKQLGKVKPLTLQDAYDKPRYLYSRDHTKYFDGCPISTTRVCASSSIDIPKSNYKDITPCETCKYGRYGEDQFLCYKKLAGLKLAKGTEVVDIERYDEYSLKSLSVKINGEVKKFYFKPLVFSNTGETVFDLWKKEKPSMATFRNIRTGYFIRIFKDPSEQQSKYHRVYGKFSKDQFNFRGESKELFDVAKKEWVLVWKVDKKEE